ncbi:MAG: HD domain-containing protein [SAR324 cluster bacterium]|uniref:HD domain-containing protein n=1 Tax=SAR324 cluster bacterium TaxID=2024889 RepID=A0A7X9IKK4_9DELT|nr:HD domain-containing protein [SAR324 cluster bacterium]
MSLVSFADVVHQSISFDPSTPCGSLILELLDTKWMQRLRDISQTANTRLVFMFSEHSRFGHSLGVAYLSNLLMEKLARHFKEDIEKYRLAVCAASLLHDLAHIAPGSHTAYKTWFPGQKDEHETLLLRVLSEDQEISSILLNKGSDLLEQVQAIISESNEVPPWTWELISGGGWNADRGNWCVVDSILAGVSYGKYNIPALIESIVLTPKKHLALKENRLDAMMHFAVSRHALYKQLYQHRVLLAADMLNKAIVQRARDLSSKLNFADDTMQEVLRAKGVKELSLRAIFRMSEAWWRYHLYQWRDSKDTILSDLCTRLLFRELLKTVRVQENEDSEETREYAKECVIKAGFDPRYYFHEVSTFDTQSGDMGHSMKVLMDNGNLLKLSEAEPLFEALIKESANSKKHWFVMPSEAKILMGRKR